MCSSLSLRVAASIYSGSALDLKNVRVVASGSPNHRV
jgi:hypothetical protein